MQYICSKDPVQPEFTAGFQGAAVFSIDNKDDMAAITTILNFSASCTRILL